MSLFYSQILIMFIILDILILFINIYIYYLELNFISINSFSQISDYLNKKYESKKNIKSEKLTNKSIRIHFMNYHPDPFHYNLINNIIKLLKKKYTVNVTSENPDYLIYNIFGCDQLMDKYSNSIKIAYFTENQIPDFNTADYSIGHSHIHYLDRYFKMPIYFIKSIISFNNDKIKEIRKKTLNNPMRTKFCAAIISNEIYSDGFRIHFINELNKYKAIDMGGKYKNNVGKINNKTEFLSSYKFSIAMENTEGDGYVSEKIIDAYLSGTIPIYYGDYMVDEYINPETYILIRGEKDINMKIEYIKQIDNNDELYRNFLRKKVLNNKLNTKTIIKEFIQFLEHIISQNKNKAKRIDNIFI